MAAQKQKIAGLEKVVTDAASPDSKILKQAPGSANEVGDMLTYCNKIQNMAQDGLDWALYDAHYRFQRTSSNTVRHKAPNLSHLGPYYACC